MDLNAFKNMVTIQPSQKDSKRTSIITLAHVTANDDFGAIPTTRLRNQIVAQTALPDFLARTTLILATVLDSCAWQSIRLLGVEKTIVNRCGVALRVAAWRLPKHSSRSWSCLASLMSDDCRVKTNRKYDGDESGARWAFRYAIIGMYMLPDVLHVIYGQIRTNVVHLCVSV